MIQGKIGSRGKGSPMATAESGDIRYRTYIQRRRVTSPDEDAEKKDSESGRIAEFAPDNRESGLTRDLRWDREIRDLIEKADSIPPVQDYEKPVAPHMEHDAGSDARTSYRKQDSSIYRKLYSRPGYRTTPYPSYKSYAGQQAQVEDNRATLIAIKIIKQSLACFAILGIIVLMQGRPDMQNTLAVIKKYVVETHIEPRSFFENVRDVFNKIVHTFGG